MKSRRFLALLLALSLLIGAAPSRANALGFLERLFSDEPEKTSYPVIPFSQMEYTRPDLAALQAMADEAVGQAQEKNMDQALEALYAFYDAIDQFSTNSALASIHYNADLTDEYWAEENDFCTGRFHRHCLLRRALERTRGHHQRVLPQRPVYHQPLRRGAGGIFLLCVHLLHLREGGYD